MNGSIRPRFYAVLALNSFSVHSDDNKLTSSSNLPKKPAMTPLPAKPHWLMLYLIPLIAVWSLGLLLTLHLQNQEQVKRLRGQNHIVETVAFYVRERQALPLKTALEILRQESGYTSLSLCHRGQMVLSAGAVHKPCDVAQSSLIEAWHRPLPAIRGYTLSAETQIVTLGSSLGYLLLFLSFSAGLVGVVLVYREAISRKVQPLELKLRA